MIWSRCAWARKRAAWTEGSMGRLSSMKPLQWRNSLLAYLKGRAVSASMRAAADMSFISSKMYSAQVFPLRTGFGIGSGSSSTVIEASCAWNSALRPEGFSSFWFFCFSRAATAARYSSQRFVSISTTSIASMSLSAATIDFLSLPVATGALSGASLRPEPSIAPGGRAGPTLSSSSSLASSCFLRSSSTNTISSVCSHTRIERSLDTVTIMLPSRATATDQTSAWWAESVMICSNLSASQNFTCLSLPVVTT
mmetsp:Transcript_7613/g.14911  ORF Transcript_7613/g.14911 Transcript_7613/m.14911 type:complete len:253 (-) Transcript_7613:258-1016(-)